MGEVVVAADFKDKVGNQFLIQVDVDGDGELDRINLALKECTDLTPNEFPGKKRDPFSLIFTGAMTMALSQGIYSVKHEDTGDSHDMFLVPLGPGEDGDMRYQAVFT
jgi:hypothetical protein